MRYVLTICACAALILISPARAADDIYDLIMHGQWEKASDLLGQQADVRENGTLLFFESLLEPNANRAARLMQSALEHQADRKYQEEIYFRLTQYYLLIENSAKVLAWAHDYQTKWAKGHYQAAILRMVVLANEFDQRFDAAAKANAEYLKQFGGGDQQAWGLVDNIRILQETKQLSTASGTLEDILKSRSEITMPPVEYILASTAVDGKNMTSAAGYLGQLRQEYPDAIGVDVLRKRVGTLAQAPQSQPEPAGWLHAQEGKLPGDFSIMAGAYLAKSDARQQAKRMKSEKLPTDIATFMVDGKKYYVVYIGRFKSREEADHTNERLRQEYGEKYEVVIR